MRGNRFVSVECGKRKSVCVCVFAKAPNNFPYNTFLLHIIATCRYVLRCP